MSEHQFCSRCGTKLAQDAQLGPCPKCLMQMGFDSVPPTLNSDKPSGSPIEEALSIQRLAHLFPELEIVSQLGQGGMGVVYKAKQKNLDRFVALKVLRPEHGDDPTFAERFIREARALAKLNHPAIISVFDFGQRGNVYFLIMEFVEGANLRVISKTNPLTPEQALAIVPQICDALQYAHDEGVVHRDIKPENILLDKRGRLKIADFGLAKMLRTSADDFTLTGTRQIVGTPHYMAPEQMEKPQSVDHRADIYSLGVVIYEMLTGELPLGRFAPPSEKVRIDVKLDEVVLRTLAKEPELRYQHATDVKTHVERITGVHPHGIASPPNADAESLVGRTAKAMAILGKIEFFIAACFLLACFEDDDFFIGVLIHVVAGGVFTIGSWNLRKKKSYSLAIISALLCIVPCHLGAFLGVFIGPWTIYLLLRSDVRQMFGKKPKIEIPPELSSIKQAFHTHGQDSVQKIQHATQHANGYVVRCLKWFFTLGVTICRRFFGLPWRRMIGITTACAIWTTVACIVAFFVSMEAFEHAPSQYSVYDYSSRLVPRSGAFNSLRIQATGRGTAVGKHPPLRKLKRDSLNFSLVTNNSRRQHQLQVRMPPDEPAIASGESGMDSHYWPFFDQETTVEEWMQGLGIDTSPEAVQAEIRSINRLINLMSIDGGIDESLRPRIRPVIELLGLEHFKISEDRYGGTVRSAQVHVQPQDWVYVAVYGSTAIVVILGNVIVIWAVLVILRSNKNRHEIGDEAKADASYGEI